VTICYYNSNIIDAKNKMSILVIIVAI